MALFTDDVDISLQIESYVSENGGNYIDATLAICEGYCLEPDVVAKYVSKPIKEKLELEAREMNMFPNKRSKPKLPFMT